MGILNVTPDSFSDGGRYNDVDAAVDRCSLMIREGADCIDLGAEATGPNSVPISSEEELERLIPVLEAVRSRFDIPLSVDTFKSETAKEAITAGCDIINDITGFMGDPEMAKVVADNGTGVILMFNKRTNGENPIAFEPVSRRAVRELTESVEIAKKAGIPDNMIMTDPGIGFGTNRAEDAELTAATLSMGLHGKYPVLYAASRKRYARVFAGGDQATELMLDNATAGLSVTAASLGAAMVRVHNVAASRQILDVFDTSFYAFANL
jgi:dihydropteroate synthase